MKRIKVLLMLIGLVPVAAFASSGVSLDKAPGRLSDQASLQRGARVFIANCLACHSAAYMRYNRLKDIGMSEQDIKKLLPEGEKIGSTMQSAMDSASAKAAFGVAPPDLSVIARSRGTDWLYTYLRSFYVDPSRPTGVNNLVFPMVAMPNVLGGMQGEQVLHIEKHDGHEVKRLELKTPGSMKPEEFNALVGDLVNYLDFMSEPAKLVRYRLGYIVLAVLAVLLALSYALKREFWKDIH